jgi:glycosyltransferase involved in cell wall biosynthesis
MEMGAQSCAQIARYLPLHGWSPIVLTVKEEYIDEEYIGSNSNGSGHFNNTVVVKTRVLPHPFDFYRWTKSLIEKVKSTVRGSVETSESASQRSNSDSDEKSRLRKYMLSLFNVPDLHTGWLLPGVVAGLRAIKQNNVRVIFSSAPFFTGHLIGYVLATLTKLPWVIHFRDPTTGPVHSGKKSLPLKLRLKLEEMVVRRADRVVCVTREHAASLQEQYPECEPGKFFAVPNGFDAEEWIEIDQTLERVAGGDGQKNKFVILYAGQIYFQRTPEPVFQALQTLIESGELTSEELQFDLVGWCETIKGRNVADVVTKMNLQDCVRILGPKSRHDTLRRMTQADLLLLLAEGWTVQIPGKTYEYMKARRPILALTSEGTLANFIRSTHSGWSLDPTDVEGIKSAIREAYAESKSGLKHVADPATINKFDRRETTRELARIFDEIVV